ncbi:MAG: metallophosphoesterase family protein [Candidatus Thorarchaeota archaeon]|nr:metallophosphoesterase family protein [Candidatus Thorarchaeota archaeon]
MPARIAHISDTHLGSRPRNGVRHNIWGEEMKAQLLENDFYERFAELFEKIAEIDPPVDLVVHSGDLYNSPWEGNPSQPPVHAQITAMKVLQKFIETTGIPVLIIEGNHGLFKLYEVSLLDSLGLAVPGLKVSTQQDLKKAIRDGTPLEFSFEKLDVFCFPYIDSAVLQSSNMIDIYDDWITTHQKRERLRPSIAITHGMKLDNTLYSAIFSMGYDYVALGHDHRQVKHSSNAWYAGSPERWRFDETSREKGFLIVDIEAGKDPEITPYHLEFKRPVLNEKMAISEDDTVDSITEKVESWFAEKGLVTSWDSNTAARVRLVFEGSSKRLSGFDLGIALESSRQKVLSHNSEYNIAQYVWDIRQSSDAEYTAAAYPEIESEYLIEDPEVDFKGYLDTLEVDKNFDVEMLTKIAVTSLEFAVGKREGKMTTDALQEDEK